MTTKFFRYKIIVLILFTSWCNTGESQLYISSTDFITQSDATVFVNGDLHYDGIIDQAFHHNGLLEIKGNWYNTAVTDKKVFTDASSGIVLLSGALQTFNGFNTRFPKLTLSGTAKKQQLTTIEIRDVLDLTDIELDVNGNVVKILSDQVSAIKYDEGYINTSARSSGWLARNMDNKSSYIFPLGNQNGSLFRFRPLVISAQNSGNVYGQFQNYNPSTDGFPASLKAADIETVDDKWYHAVTTDAAAGNHVNVQVPESFITDGVFSKLVSWNNDQRQWQTLPSTGAIPSVDYKTNDHIFKTSGSVAINNTRPVDINLATEHADEFMIPNVITPNGDSYNEKWVIKGLDATAQNEVVIFNRWNNVVFESKNYRNDWNGKGLNAGTYFYILKVKKNGSEKMYKGYVMIMR